MRFYKWSEISAEIEWVHGGMMFIYVSMPSQDSDCRALCMLNTAFKLSPSLEHSDEE